MIQLKDVIHYYVGCQCIMDGKEKGRLMGISPIPNSVNQIYYDVRTEDMTDEEDDFSMPYNDNPDESELRIKPILKRIGDMSRKQFEEIKEGLSGDIVLAILGSVYNHITILENRIQTNTLRLLDGLTLIKYGYDVFDLIESGQAIDAKTMS